MRNKIIPFGIAICVILDQVTKFLVKANIPYGDCVEVIPGFFNLTSIHNIGCAWGMLAGWQLILVIMALIVLSVITIWRKKIFGAGKLANTIFILLFSGILGNMLDRIIFGYVMDFLDFHIKSAHFPSFNVADSCICIGCLLFIIQSYKEEKSKQ